MPANGLVGFNIPGIDPVDNGFGGDTAMLAGLGNCHDVIHDTFPEK